MFSNILGHANSRRKRSISRELSRYYYPPEHVYSPERRISLNERYLYWTSLYKKWYKRKFIKQFQLLIDVFQHSCVILLITNQLSDRLLHRRVSCICLEKKERFYIFISRKEITFKLERRAFCLLTLCFSSKDSPVSRRKRQTKDSTDSVTDYILLRNLISYGTGKVQPIT